MPRSVLVSLNPRFYYGFSFNDLNAEFKVKMRTVKMKNKEYFTVINGSFLNARLEPNAFSTWCYKSKNDGWNTSAKDKL